MMDIRWTYGKNTGVIFIKNKRLKSVNYFQRELDRKYLTGPQNAPLNKNRIFVIFQKLF